MLVFVEYIFPVYWLFNKKSYYVFLLTDLLVLIFNTSIVLKFKIVVSMVIKRGHNYIVVFELKRQMCKAPLTG